MASTTLTQGFDDQALHSPLGSLTPCRPGDGASSSPDAPAARPVPSSHAVPGRRSPLSHGTASPAPSSPHPGAPHLDAAAAAADASAPAYDPDSHVIELSDDGKTRYSPTPSAPSVLSTGGSPPPPAALLLPAAAAAAALAAQPQAPPEAEEAGHTTLEVAADGVGVTGPAAARGGRGQAQQHLHVVAEDEVSSVGVPGWGEREQSSTQSIDPLSILPRCACWGCVSMPFGLPCAVLPGVPADLPAATSPKHPALRAASLAAASISSLDNWLGSAAAGAAASALPPRAGAPAANASGVPPARRALLSRALLNASSTNTASGAGPAAAAAAPPPHGPPGAAAPPPLGALAQRISSSTLGTSAGSAGGGGGNGGSPTAPAVVGSASLNASFASWRLGWGGGSAGGSAGAAAAAGSGGGLFGSGRFFFGSFGRRGSGGLGSGSGSGAAAAAAAGGNGVSAEAGGAGLGMGPRGSSEEAMSEDLLAASPTGRAGEEGGSGGVGGLVSGGSGGSGAEGEGGRGGAPGGGVEASASRGVAISPRGAGGAAAAVVAREASLVFRAVAPPPALAQLRCDSIDVAAAMQGSGAVVVVSPREGAAGGALPQVAEAAEGWAAAGEGEVVAAAEGPAAGRVGAADGTRAAVEAQLREQVWAGSPCA